MAELTTIGQSKTFNYTGNVQSIVLAPGRYKMECYGARGGGGNGGDNIAYAGLGGYTKGVLEIYTQTTFYIYVGGIGSWIGRTGSGGWNGGGTANNQNSAAGSGGGATDIRLVSGTWDNLASLRSRIMVAGGGGGGGRYDVKGGNGGGLTGGDGVGATGASQTAGGTSNGSFGKGGDGPNTNYGKGCGGGGYYGGGANGTGNSWYHSGGGGSSFISGMSGCNAINSSGSHTGQPNHYSGLVFSECSTSSGVNSDYGKAVISRIGHVYTINVSKDSGIQSIKSNIDLASVKPGDTITLSAETFSPGYKWSHWSGDYEQSDETLSFVMPDKNVNITANSTVRDDTPYQVNHYLLNVDGITAVLKETTQHTGTTNASVIPPVNSYLGFISPELKTGVINGDGSTTIDYYYNRNTYTLTLLNGISDKYDYLFEETAWIVYDKMDDAIYTFDYWNSEQQVDIDNIKSNRTMFKMPPYDVTIFVVGKLNRLNTNIYKNIFPDVVLDMDIVNKTLDDTIVTSNDIKQQNHGLSVGDVVYIDEDGLYKKALAEDSEKAFPVGIVSDVVNSNIFTLIGDGKTHITIRYNYEDTSVLYLSDKIPGKFVHYKEIQNKIYVPVAIYTNQGIVVNIQQGSKGANMLPYGTIIDESRYEFYTEEEISEVINTIKDGVK